MVCGHSSQNEKIPQQILQQREFAVGLQNNPNEDGRNRTDFPAYFHAIYNDQPKGGTLFGNGISLCRKASAIMRRAIDSATVHSDSLRITAPHGSSRSGSPCAK